jgi:hypothetical protein
MGVGMSKQISKKRSSDEDINEDTSKKPKIRVQLDDDSIVGGSIHDLASFNDASELSLTEQVS